MATTGFVESTLLRDGAWLRLVFRHPKGNVLTIEVMAALRAALAEAGAHPHLRLVTLEGAGADFSFGAAIEEHRPGEIDRALPQAHALVADLLAIEAPTAAIVRGRCLGGGFELALACDFIFAAEDASFGLPEIALGVFPPAASILLPARVGLARATRAILTGEAGSAAMWREAGLVTLVAPAPELQARVEGWFAAHLAPRSAAGLRYAVRAVRRDLQVRVERELPVVERLYLEQLMDTRDAVEGVTAFLEKRPPAWQDR